VTGNRLLTTAAITCLGAGAAALGALMLWPADEPALHASPRGAADQECTLGTLLRTGTLCEEAAPPQLLLVEAAQDEEDEVPPAPAPTLAAVLSPVVSVPVEPPPAPAAPVPAPVPAKAPPAPITAPAGRPAFLVVVGSYAHRGQAEDRLRSLGWGNLDITEATVQGRPYYRVTIRSDTREQAVRALHAARAAGIRDAWLLPATGGTSTAPDTAIAQRAG